MYPTCLRSALVLLVSGLLAACSPSPQSAQSSAQPSVNARAQQNLELYLKLRKGGKYELAAPIGAGVVKRAPGSKAAATIGQTLAETQAKADAINKKRRLKRAWIYQSGEQSGGWQNTASLYPTLPVDLHRRIRLILRKHTDWGTSLYLYDGNDQGFVCQGNCQLPLKVDGKTVEPLEAAQPPTGEPALFLHDEQRLLKLLASAETLAITVDLKGSGKQELYFEVSGFDPKQWPQPEAPEAEE